MAGRIAHIKEEWLQPIESEAVRAAVMVAVVEYQLLGREPEGLQGEARLAFAYIRLALDAAAGESARKRRAVSARWGRTSEASDGIDGNTAEDTAPVQCASESVRVCNKTIPGITHYADDLVAEIDLSKEPETGFRKVIHRQSNAIRFEGGSWLQFRPMNKHTKRAAYEIEDNSGHFLMLIDKRMPYENQFGTTVAAQTTVMIYKLKK